MGQADHAKRHDATTGRCTVSGFLSGSVLVCSSLMFGQMSEP
jgi:hypothetical protein